MHVDLKSGVCAGMVVSCCVYIYIYTYIYIYIYIFINVVPTIPFTIVTSNFCPRNIIMSGKMQLLPLYLNFVRKLKPLQCKNR
jgi:hypothetical protein